MTAGQAKLLAFIRRYQNEKGITPSYDEMREAMGLVSKSGIHRLIVGLEMRGRITRLEGRARAIEIVPSAAALAEANAERIATRAVKMISDICGREETTSGPMLTIRLIAQQALARVSEARL